MWSILNCSSVSQLCKCWDRKIFNIFSGSEIAILFVLGISYTVSHTVLFMYLQIQETKARLILFPVIFCLCIVHFSFSLLLSSLLFYYFCCSGHHIIVLAVLIQSLIPFLNSLPPHTRIHPPFPIDSFCSCHPFLLKL